MWLLTNQPPWGASHMQPPWGASHMAWSQSPKGWYQENEHTLSRMDISPATITSPHSGHQALGVRSKYVLFWNFLTQLFLHAPAYKEGRSDPSGAVNFWGSFAANHAQSVSSRFNERASTHMRAHANWPLVSTCIHAWTLRKMNIHHTNTYMYTTIF